MRYAPKHPTLAFAVATLLAMGCLPNTYVVPGAEVQRLIQTPPAERGHNVHVAQEFFGTDVPSDTGYSPYRMTSAQQQQVGHVHIHTSTCWNISGSRTCGYRWRAGARADGVRVHAGAGAEPVGPRGVPSSKGPPAAGAAKGFQGGGSSIDVGDARAIAVIIVLAAAALTVGLIATEGMRFEGTVDVDANHPVHLVQSNGGVRTVALSELTASDVASVSEVIMVDNQGDGFNFGNSSPLNRVGFVWRMEGGVAAMLMPDDNSTYVPTVNMTLGYFPLQQLGFTFFTTLGWGDYLDTQLFSVRYGLDVEVMPVALGRFHPGVYGSIGMTFAAMDEGTFPDHSYHVMRVTTGFQLEVELTTLLSLTARVGPFWEKHRTGYELPGMEASLGVAIY